MIFRRRPKNSIEHQKLMLLLKEQGLKSRFENNWISKTEVLDLYKEIFDMRNSLKERERIENELNEVLNLVDLVLENKKTLRATKTLSVQKIN